MGTELVPTNGSGTFFNIFHTTGATLSAINISTVPPTAGVSTLRRAPILAVNRKADSEATQTSVASSGTPPLSTADTATETKATLEPTNNTKPPPIMPMRLTCSQLDTPQASSAANTSQLVVPASRPAARDTTSGVIMIPVTMSTAICAPSPADSRCDGFSCGS